ncbi:HNH endonuclease family protein [Vibrio owensii]|uniref:hypothetical protein n=1 Tax=Vibrio owensii TaxID=696485 RepID=UPI00390A9EFA
MRQVDRSSVNAPHNLNNLTAVNELQLESHTTVSSAVYRHQNVKDSLQELYFDKCYICECDVKGGYKVEHYLPKKHFPSLGYTWSNLHKACEGCNLAKEHKDFLVTDATGTVIDINLLDPSNPNYNISDYMRFNINSEAELVPVGTDPAVIAKAQNTIKYLNGQYKNEYGKELKHQRGSRSHHLLLFMYKQLSQFNELIQQIKRAGIAQYTAPQCPNELDMHHQLCNKLIALDHMYLSDRAPFSSCTRVSMVQSLEMPYQSLVDMKEKMRATLGI